jgi:hypothetical protein
MTAICCASWATSCEPTASIRGIVCRALAAASALDVTVTMPRQLRFFQPAR